MLHEGTTFLLPALQKYWCGSAVPCLGQDPYRSSSTGHPDLSNAPSSSVKLVHGPCFKHNALESSHRQRQLCLFLHFLNPLPMPLNSGYSNPYQDSSTFVSLHRSYTPQDILGKLDSLRCICTSFGTLPREIPLAVELSQSSAFSSSRGMNAGTVYD